MTPLHEKEIGLARQNLAQAGRDPDDFGFAVSFMDPDPDGGGMYTVRYEVAVTCEPTGRAAAYIGGIGLDWVGDFTADLNGGDFD